MRRTPKIKYPESWPKFKSSGDKARKRAELVNWGKLLPAFWSKAWEAQLCLKSQAQGTKR